jgi:hypothetical protein
LLVLSYGPDQSSNLRASAREQPAGCFTFFRKATFDSPLGCGRASPLLRERIRTRCRARNRSL